jgi:hypothetical protein
MTGGDQEELSPWSLARHSLRSRFFFIGGSVDKGESQSQLAGDRAAWLVRHMKDDDLRAVNAYLNSIPPVRNAVPEPIREPKKPQRRPHFLHEPPQARPSEGPLCSTWREGQRVTFCGERRHVAISRTSV